MIAEHVAEVRRQIDRAAIAAGRNPADITLCAATKTQTDESIQAVIAAGVTICGENRVQELTAHLAQNAYAGSAVHFIGHLQTNKVKQVVGQVDMIQSVDSQRLLQAIQAQAEKLDIVQNILLEVNIGREENKGGILPEALEELAQMAVDLPNISLRGLMAIPPVSLSPGDTTPFFEKMHQLFVDITAKMSDNQNTIECLSMGMSGDFKEAVACGATLVRVGTALFGARPSTNTVIDEKRKEDF